MYSPVAKTLKGPSVAVIIWRLIGGVNFVNILSYWSDATQEKITKQALSSLPTSD